MKNAKSIGYQGVPGCNSEAAAIKFSPWAQHTPFHTFYEVFEALENDDIELAILPVENSLEGRIKEVNELLIDNDHMIVGELNLPIRYCLLINRGTHPEDIRYVYSHLQALGQCREFIGHKKLEPVPYYDTAGAALMLARDRPKRTAAIARRECADLYELDILASGIEDRENNMTRFVVIGKDGKESGDKISIVFSTFHEPGALYSVLEIFAAAGIDLTRIESIPTREEPWRYNFFLDLRGDIRDEAVRMALKKAEDKALSFKYLGCYLEDDYPVP